jgi:hypothetical protein
MEFVLACVLDKDYGPLVTDNDNKGVIEGCGGGFEPPAFGL